MGSKVAPDGDKFRCACTCGQFSMNVTGQPEYLVECLCSSCARATDTVARFSKVSDAVKNQKRGSVLTPTGQMVDLGSYTPGLMVGAWYMDCYDMPDGLEKLDCFMVDDESGNFRIYAKCCATYIGSQYARGPLMLINVDTLSPDLSTPLQARVQIKHARDKGLMSRLPKDGIHNTATWPWKLKFKMLRAFLFSGKRRRELFPCCLSYLRSQKTSG